MPRFERDYYNLEGNNVDLIGAQDESLKHYGIYKATGVTPKVEGQEEIDAHNRKVEVAHQAARHFKKEEEIKQRKEEKEAQKAAKAEEKATKAEEKTAKRERSGSAASFTESLVGSVRRLSIGMKETFGIVAMDKRERHDYLRKRDSAASMASAATFDSSAGSTPPLNSARFSNLENAGKPLPGRIEKVALNISKAADPLKAIVRPATAESNMSFGMVDTAPEGMMIPCVCCKAPTGDYLKDGICKDCQTRLANINAKANDHGVAAGLFIDPWLIPQGNPTLSPEHGYMKLAGRRKLLRLRKTMYADLVSGNPFGEGFNEDDVEPVIDPSDKPLPPAPERSESGRESFWGYGPLSRKHEVVSPTPRSTVVNSPASARPTHRRSMSAALDLPSPTHGTDVYIPPRQYWQRQASMPVVPTMTFEKQEGESEVRNTKFYGFYDLLESYHNMDSTM